nr:unnamed protein product [Callosobruchus analis]
MLDPPTTTAICPDQPERRATAKHAVSRASLLDGDLGSTNTGNEKVTDAQASISFQIAKLQTTPPRQAAEEGNQKSEALTSRLEPNRFPYDAFLYEPSKPMPSTSKQQVFSPEAVRPYPKAPPRKLGSRGRKTKKSAIYTDTPEKKTVRKEYEERQKRLKNKKIKKTVFEPSNKNTSEKGKGKARGPTKKKKTRTPPDSTDEDECYCLICLEAYSASWARERMAKA